MEEIKSKILTIRGLQVMLDKTLAELYEVSVKDLNMAVKRNIERFPSDFMFKLTKAEAEASRCQFGALKKGRGSNIKYLPYAFSENGVAMLSSVLNSQRAILVNIQIMRAFVAMKSFLNSNAQVFQRLDRVEIKQLGHDKKFEQVFNALKSKDNTPN